MENVKKEAARTIFNADRLIGNKKRKELVEKAREDSFEQQYKEKLTQERKLDELTQKSSRVIYQLHSVWPFDFFPTRITLFEDKITIVDKYFFRSAEIMSFPIDRLLTVRVQTSIFFATIAFETLVQPNIKPGVPFPLTYLPRRKTIYAARLMNGAIICARQRVDLSKIDDLPILRRKLEEIGYSQEQGRI